MMAERALGPCNQYLQKTGIMGTAGVRGWMLSDPTLITEGLKRREETQDRKRGRRTKEESHLRHRGQTCQVENHPKPPV